jgi:folate-binding Fe-S cluster repair protein YgfZ
MTVGESSTVTHTTLALARSARINQRRQAMNEEYLQAKFNLCIDQAEKDLKEQDIANAIKNLQRANSAMSRLFGLEEDGE